MSEGEVEHWTVQVSKHDKKHNFENHWEFKDFQAKKKKYPETKTNPMITFKSRRLNRKEILFIKNIRNM